MGYNSPGSSVLGILQARILRWVALPSSGDLPNLGIEPKSPALQADSLPVEPQGKPLMETMTDFIFLGSKITADGDCSHKIKRQLLLGRKAMTNLDSILKNRDITLPMKVFIVKAMVFPVVTYGCESWTIKKAEQWRIDAFELWCWRRLLRVPCTERTGTLSILIGKSILNIHWKDWCWSWSTNTLSTWCKSWLIRKDRDAGKDWRQEEKRTAGDEMVGWHHRLNGHEFEQALGVDEGQGSLACFSPWGHKELDMTEWLNNNKKIGFVWFSNWL